MQATREETLSILQDLIGFPTVSADSNLALIGYAADRLRDLGAEVKLYRDESGAKANLFATIGPEVDGGIVLSGHSDVVPVADQDWSSDPFEMRIADGKAYGRGTCDMKGFIAASLAMAPHYAAQDLKRPVHFAFTHDEEVGCLGAQALMHDLALLPFRPAVCIIGEPTEMRIIEGHKGCCEYTVTFTGMEGHGSQPDLGVNAVEYAVRYVTKLMELREALKGRVPEGSRFDPPWSTLQIGRLSGGVAHNVIPGLATLDWEMRPVVKADMDFVKDRIADYVKDELLPAMRKVSPDADIVTQVIGEVDGLEPVPENEALRIVAELTGANGADLVAFGTEAGLFQKLGISTVVCGPGSIEQAHKPDEFIALDQIDQCLTMLERLTAKLTT
ncbi:MAG: acetylornithine deacetylase [Nisaea sp.]|uniref:acetylornithine deacetylase n=1 Tax=Nisaea sp. TaxID=2024842 RepID=UPI001B287202|nr:acetylornithine deacetylase [Nisaea sp.]MBO6561005.1 acetylornithine deacetylase [Nisaea sp.]